MNMIPMIAYKRINGGIKVSTTKEKNRDSYGRFVSITMWALFVLSLLMAFIDPVFGKMMVMVMTMAAVVGFFGFLAVLVFISFILS